MFNSNSNSVLAKVFGTAIKTNLLKDWNCKSFFEIEWTENCLSCSRFFYFFLCRCVFNAQTSNRPYQINGCRCLVIEKLNKTFWKGLQPCLMDVVSLSAEYKTRQDNRGIPTGARSAITVVVAPICCSLVYRLKCVKYPFALNLPSIAF